MHDIYPYLDPRPFRALNAAEERQVRVVWKAQPLGRVAPRHVLLWSHSQKPEYTPISTIKIFDYRIWNFGPFGPVA